MIESSRYKYVIAVAAFMVWFAAWGSYSTFSIFLKPIIEDLGWRRADITLAYSVSSIVQAICALVMGRLTDRLGPRIVVSIFGSFIAISYFLLGNVSLLWQYQIIYALIGSVGLSTATIPIMATIARWFTKKRGAVTGLVQAGMGIGGLFFAPLTGWMIKEFGWRISYQFLSLITFPLMLFFGLLLKRDPVNTLCNTYNPVGFVQKTNKSSLPIGLTVGKALKTPQFWMLAVMFLSFGFCRCTFLAHTGAHVQDLGFSLSAGANVMAALTFSSIFGRVGAGFLGDKIGIKTTYLLGFTIMIIALVCGRYAEQLWLMYIFAILFGMAWGGQAVSRFIFSAEMFGLTSLGAITGTLGLMEAGGAAFGSYTAGLVFDLAGNYDIMFTLGLLLSVFGGFICWRIRPIIR